MKNYFNNFIDFLLLTPICIGLILLVDVELFYEPAIWFAWVGTAVLYTLLWREK